MQPSSTTATGKSKKTQRLAHNKEHAAENKKHGRKQDVLRVEAKCHPQAHCQLVPVQHLHPPRRGLAAKIHAGKVAHSVGQRVLTHPGLYALTHAARLLHCTQHAGAAHLGCNPLFSLDRRAPGMTGHLISLATPHKRETRDASHVTSHVTSSHCHRHPTTAGAQCARSVQQSAVVGRAHVTRQGRARGREGEREGSGQEVRRAEGKEGEEGRHRVDAARVDAIAAVLEVVKHDGTSPWHGDPAVDVEELGLPALMRCLRLPQRAVVSSKAIASKPCKHHRRNMRTHADRQKCE